MDAEKKRGRPISYSDSHIHLGHKLTPLLLTPSSSMLSLEIESPPSPSPSPSPRSPWLPFFYGWALRFLFHITLISLFENMFFWHFVSQSEDTALISLVDHYMARTLTNCANLTVPEKQVMISFLDLFMNETRVDAAGTAAGIQRATYNAGLMKNSWIYFGSLIAVFSALAIAGHLRKYPTEWRIIVGENLALVIFLGLYEWMFFSTVALRYQSISFEELDQRIVDELQTTC